MTTLRSFLRRHIGPRAAGTAKRLPDIAYSDDPPIARLAFICGLHRSGTTLLERLLVANFHVSCLRADVPQSEGQHLQSVYKPARAYGGPGRFARDPRMRADLDAIPATPDTGAAILKDWSRFVVGTAPVLLEKSPPNLTKIAWLRAAFPGARFVILTRDPRAVAAATQKWAKTPMADLMANWHAAHQAALDDIDDRDCLTLRYEDLCAAPARHLTAVAEFLDIPRRSSDAAFAESLAPVASSNARYLAATEGQSFGPGAWDAFGYDVT